MIKVEIKPMSVNRAWKGRRFKTEEYKQYEKSSLFLLPRKCVIPEGNLQLYLLFGVSNRGFDNDNSIKQFTDILQKKYHFNDNRIFRTIADKEIVKKGEEYIKFEITSMKELKYYKPPKN